MEFKYQVKFELQDNTVSSLINDPVFGFLVCISWIFVRRNTTVWMTVGLKEDNS